MNLQPGDKVVRITPPTRLFPATLWTGIVDAVGEEGTVVRCKFIVDQPRTCCFFIDNGGAVLMNDNSYIVPMATLEKVVAE